MGKIIFIYFTFLGINTSYAQKPAVVIDSMEGNKKAVVKKPTKKAGSMVLTDRSSIRLYPNPAKNRINVEISGFDPGFVQVQLLDNKGNLVSDNIRTVFSGNEIIVLMFLEKPGLYYLWLKQGEKNHKSKLIIQ